MDKSARSPGLIQRDREALQARHYARRTVTSYEQGLRRFLRFHALRHPREMGSAEVNAFLTHLAVEQRVSPSTQNQALAALLFLDRDLLERDLELNGVMRAVLQRLDGVESLVAGCFTAAACGSWKPCGCGRRISTSTAAPCCLIA